MRPADICVLAQDFITTFPSRQIPNGTHKKQVIRDSDDSLLKDTSVYACQRSVVIKAFPNEDAFWGMLVRGRVKSKIYVSSKLNNCWTRFVVAKELCHLIIDNSEGKSYTTDLIELASNLITRNVQIDSHALNSEPLAMIMACELMMPYSQNDTLASSSNSYHIAMSFGMPEKMIDMMRSEWYQSIRREGYSS